MNSTTGNIESLKEIKKQMFYESVRAFAYDTYKQNLNTDFFPV